MQRTERPMEGLRFTDRPERTHAVEPPPGTEAIAHGPDESRSVPIELIEDEEFPAAPGFQEAVSETLRWLRSYYAREFGIEFRWGATRPWRPTGVASGAVWTDLWSALLAVEPKESGALLIALSARPTSLSSADGPPAEGYGEPLGQRVLVSLPGNTWSTGSLRELILHEVSHTFGAWHTTDQRSAMRVEQTTEEATELDWAAIAVVRATKWRNIDAGVAALDELSSRRVGALFAHAGAPATEHPVVRAWMNRGRAAAARGDGLAAVAYTDEAMAIMSRDLPRACAEIADLREFRARLAEWACRPR